jgi:glycosyltransferase involved in cell wall biosynthesis
MKKTKILFLARRYVPHIGGVETHVAELNTFLLTKNMEITVLTEKHDPVLPKRETVDGVEVRRISLPNGQTNKLAIWWWVFRHSFLFLNADIIHIHDVFFWILPLYPLLKIFRKKIYMTFHGYEAPGPLTQKQIFWHRYAARMTRGNICVGGFHKKYYGVKPDVITYGGVKRSSHIQTMKPKYAIAFVGRLAKDTGILAYLQALKLLHDQKKKIHLDIFGDGELRKECEEYIQKNDLDVKIHGYVLNATDHFPEYKIVFASQYLSLLKAMSSSCSVIAYADTPIKHDYLTLTPFAEWISIAENAEEIALAVKEPKIMNKHGVGWAKKQTWEKVAEEYKELWEK